MGKKALVVLSGGQDSTCALFYAKRAGYEEIQGITFDYGQKHITELESARKIAHMNSIPLEVVNLKGVLKAQNCTRMGDGKDLDTYEQSQKAKDSNAIPTSFVPHRNALFFLVAFNRAHLIGATDIITGICEEDGTYPDTTAQFRSKMDDTVNESLGNPQPAYRTVAPFLHTPKHEVLNSLRDVWECFHSLAYSTTSYSGIYPPVCDNLSNHLRAESFQKANMPDPLVLRAYHERLMDLPATANYDEVRNVSVVSELEAYLRACFTAIQVP